jgi:hypothetical protein
MAMIMTTYDYDKKNKITSWSFSIIGHRELEQMEQRLNFQVLAEGLINCLKVLCIVWPNIISIKTRKATLKSLINEHACLRVILSTNPSYWFIKDFRVIETIKVRRSYDRKGV